MERRERRNRVDSRRRSFGSDDRDDISFYYILNNICLRTFSILTNNNS